jgi:hypothetical protein
MRSILIVLFALAAAVQCTSQCKPHIAPVPSYDFGKEPAHLPVPKGAALPLHDFVSYKRNLQPGLTLSIYSRFEPGYLSLADGIILTREGDPPRIIPLRSLTEFVGSTYKGDPLAYNALSVTEACDRDRAIFLVAFHWNGDILSPETGILLIPGSTGVRVMTTPAISGGVIQLSRIGPLHLRLWSSLNEGICNACETRYTISDYDLRDGSPALARRVRTRRTYTSGDPLFDDRLGVRLLENKHP